MLLYANGKKSMKTSPKAIARLSQYRDILLRFRGYGSRWVYSCDLASAMGSTAAQVRKDFSSFKFAGKKKVGYEVESLLSNIDALLYKDITQSVIIVGLGTLGLCLIREQLLSAKGLKIVAAFDDATDMIKEPGFPADIPVYTVDKLVAFVKSHDIQLGIIAVCSDAAQRMLDLMALAGIRGILNLAPVDLKSPKHCFVNSVNLVREFEKTIYFADRLNFPRKSTGDEDL
jgi:redox-sensing transcriptional repressor